MDHQTCSCRNPGHWTAHVRLIKESREMLGVMPLPGSLPPQGPFLDTNA